ncbi:hypothetical protein AGOR_G00020570 [Albula goreensis]|uniref:Elastin n=1 Tax=Albula goreensis TaxID=1534307 RepID=A0A8T3E4E8_9TELE|nr:hypothetical protein AGOR_G00020570 [Albula goreensis]
MGGVGPGGVGGVGPGGVGGIRPGGVGGFGPGGVGVRYPGKPPKPGLPGTGLRYPGGAGKPPKPGGGVLGVGGLPQAYGGYGARGTGLSPQQSKAAKYAALQGFLGAGGYRGGAGCQGKYCGRRRK